MQKGNQKKEDSGKNFYLVFYIAVAILIGGYLLYTYVFKEKKEYVVNTKKLCDTLPEPQFKKEGELSFLDKNGKVLKNVDIEIADTEKDRMFGMMCRRSMEDNKAMLFVFQASEPQSFWMKNTVMSLDIIFINEDKEIVKIHRNTTPLSERSVPSEKNSMYVVETSAGFCSRYNISEGAKIQFRYL